MRGEDADESEQNAPAAGRRAPFTAVRFRRDVVEVEVEQRWAEWISIDGIPIDQLVIFSKQRYASTDGTLWQKRISEDLVDVLTALGVPPGPQVTMVTKGVDDGKLSSSVVTMTEENRHAVAARNRALARSRSDEAARLRMGGFARLAPWPGLRFEGESIDVQLEGGGAWYRLLSVGGVTADRLVAHAKGAHEARWRKRIAEDLVEVLRELGVTANEKVNAKVQDASGKVIEKQGLAMTEANRGSVKASWEEASR